MLCRTGFDGLDAIILSPNNRGLQWFEPYNHDQINTLIDMAKTYLPVDNTKIVVNGYSGNGAWWYRENQSNVFATGIPTLTYAIHEENDELLSLQNTQDWVNDTSLAGSNTYRTL